MSRPPDEPTGTTVAADTQAEALDPPLDASTRCLLVVVSKDGGTRTLEVTPGSEITFGRDESATVRVDEERVSRLHARIYRSEGAVIVEDLNSRNGTRVNESKLRAARQELMGGNRIAIGTTEVLVAIVRALPAIRTAEAGGRDPARQIVVADPEMQRVTSIASRLGRMPTTCLILGETGVGKDVVARMIHTASDRAEKPFVRFNCAATPDGLLESELFGHEKGAFTGADRKKLGYVEVADGGTLFLDEVGELPVGLQAKLLHFLEHRMITRVGSTDEIRIDARVLAATHRPLKDEVAAGRFREDLFYRLTGFTLTIPPLRERKSEILPLAQRFSEELAARLGRPVPALGSDTTEALLSHDWPGNIRELKNAIEHAFVLADTSIAPEHLPEATLARYRTEQSGSGVLSEQVSQVERANIVAALEAENGNRTRAATRLGISRRALLYKMQKYGLS